MKIFPRNFVHMKCQCLGRVVSFIMTKLDAGSFWSEMEGVPVRKLTKVIRKRSILKGQLHVFFILFFLKSFIPMTDPCMAYLPTFG